MSAQVGNTYAEGNEGGRPSLYRDEYAEQAYKLCLLGHTDKELADFFGVCESTIDNWKKAHEEFLGSVKRGKLIADADVAEAYHRRAKGFSYDEVTREGSVPDNNEDVESVKERLTITKVVTKMYPPEPGAALNWLKNRQPEKWREGFNLNINQGADLNAWSAEDVVAFQLWQSKQQPQSDDN